MPGPVYVVAQSGGKEIVSNQKNQGGASFYSHLAILHHAMSPTSHGFLD
jgi:hypothetical protein